MPGGGVYRYPARRRLTPGDRLQPGETFLDGIGRQSVVRQRILVLGSPCTRLAFGVTVLHRLPGLVGEWDVELAVDVGHDADRIGDEFPVVDVVELGRVVFGPRGVE